MIGDTDSIFLSLGEDFISPTPVTYIGDAADTGELDCSMPSYVGMYNVGTLLGCGAFGEVRLGTNKLTDEKVALKFLRKAEIQSMGAAERTSTEIQCLTTLNHRNIIRLFMVGIIKNFMFWRICVLFNSNLSSSLLVLLILCALLACGNTQICCPCIWPHGRRWYVPVSQSERIHCKWRCSVRRWGEEGIYPGVSWDWLRPQASNHPQRFKTRKLAVSVKSICHEICFAECIVLDTWNDTHYIRTYHSVSYSFLETV